jgi:putative tricarboxylic transport membrane protein
METLDHLLAGFVAAMSVQNLLFALAGCVLGTLVGVLPGVGPAAGTAILIPLTFKLDPAGAIIMLSAIYYGAMYGGTITSVLLNVPGEAASVITCIDGYQMARQGRLLHRRHLRGHRPGRGCRSAGVTGLEVRPA